jgi:hypothetical protein
MRDEMPGWAAGIADRDIRELVQYIRGFCRGALAHNLNDSIPATLQLGLRCGRPHAAPDVGASRGRVTVHAFAEVRD